VIAYVESSAVLSWLLGEPAESDVRSALVAAERTATSTLTLVECSRALARGVATGRLQPKDELAAQRLLDKASSRWILVELAGAVIERAKSSFPVEPIRSLDALHLASASQLAASSPLTLISLDERIRRNAVALGFRLAP
jgi:predicted nucleic acid-binding protein